MASKRTYLRTFRTEDEAEQAMHTKNRASRDGTLFVLFDGPSDDYAVADLRTAINMDAHYRWSV